MKAPLLKAKKPISRRIDHQSEQGAFSKSAKSFLPPPVVLSSDPISAPIQKKENGKQQSFFADPANWHYFPQNQNKSTSKQNTCSTQTKTPTGQPVAQGFFKKIGKAIKSGAKAVVGGVKSVATGVGNWVSGAANTAKKFGSNVLNSAGEFIGNAADFVRMGLTFVTEKTAPVVSIIQQMGGQIWKFVKSAGSKAGQLVDVLSRVLESGGGAIFGVLQKYGTPVLNKLVEVGTGIWSILQEIIKLGAESAGPVLDLILSGNFNLIYILKATNSGARNFILGLKNMVFSKGKAWLGSLLNLDEGVLKKLIDAGGNVLNSLFDIINNQAFWITETVLTVISRGASFVDKISSIVENPSEFLNTLKSLGQDIGKAILQRILALPQNVINEFIKITAPALIAFIAMAQKIGIPGTEAIQKLLSHLIKKGGDINALVYEVISLVQSFISGNLSIIASAIEDNLKASMEIVISFLSNILGLGKITETFSKIGNKVASTVNTVGTGIKNGAKKAWIFLKKGAKNIAKGAKKIASGIAKGPKTIGNKMKSVGSKIKSIFKRRRKKLKFA